MNQHEPPAQLTVQFVLGQATLSERELSALPGGGVVALDRRATDPVDVYANGLLVARGQAVRMGGKWGVRVQELVAGPIA